MADETTWVTAKQAAEVVSYSSRTIRGWGSNGHVRTKNEGDVRTDGKPAKTLYDLASVRAYAEQKHEAKATSKEGSGSVALAPRQVGDLLDRLHDRGTELTEVTRLLGRAEATAETHSVRIKELTERLAKMEEERNRSVRQYENLVDEYTRQVTKTYEAKAELAAVKALLTKRQKKTMGYD